MGKATAWAAFVNKESGVGVGAALAVLGYDLGATTGVSVYLDGRLAALESIKPVDLLASVDAMCAKARQVAVVFEDSRKQSVLFSGNKASVKSAAARCKVARDVGRIDAWCDLLEAHCKRLGVPILGVSPQEKGAKVAASAFEHITGWAGRTNEHERDAAMVARPFRKGFKA